jgi:hypothetical protein
MSEISSMGNMHDDSSHSSRVGVARVRRNWLAPLLAPHSTLTTLTQVPLPQPLSLLFLQSSRQCFDQNGDPAPCPGTP